MKCPNCGSENVQVQLVEAGQQTNRKGIGFGGIINNIARGFTAICTLGLSNLFWKEDKGTNETKTINNTIGVCQNCGNTWIINRGDFGNLFTSIFTSIFR